MPGIFSQQRLFRSFEDANQQPLVTGNQSVLQRGFRHTCEFFASFVSQEELQGVIDASIPLPYVMEGQPQVSEIDKIRHYNVNVVGVFYSLEPAAPGFEAAHSIRAY